MDLKWGEETDALSPLQKYAPEDRRSTVGRYAFDYIANLIYAIWSDAKNVKVK